MDIEQIIRLVMERGASDLHLVVPGPPVLRIDGALVDQDHLPGLTPEDTHQAFVAMTSEEQQRAFDEDLELDFAFGIPGSARFRVNAAMEKGTINLSLRVVQESIPDMEGLGLPEVCKTLALRPRGLVMVTGPAGSGKSTTIAAMIEYLNETTRRRIITIEDPIEFLFQKKRSTISQRELGVDTRSFAAALKHALRQDPDVVFVGEMRDLDTIAMALTTAETGHLSLTTLHTPSAPQAVDRIIDVFPPFQQQQIRIQLSTILEGVLYQALVKSTADSGRVAAVEVMLASGAIRNLIREGKTHQMYNAIETGSQYGMQTLDQALLYLVHRRAISKGDALGQARNPDGIRKMLSGLDENLRPPSELNHSPIPWECPTL
jgi:twitching motility protein PilT